jgi:hypothetical protein
MYYIMGEDDEILDVLSKLPDQEQVDRAAAMFGCTVCVMRGEHTGLSAQFVPVTDEQR